MAQDFHKALCKEFELFDSKFRSLVQGDFSIIEPISRQVFGKKGKQLRPILVFLTHKLFKPEVGEQAFLAASLIEIVHAASLVHDDVVDMADLRRGKASVRALFGNKTAVLAGDYLLSNAFLKAYDHSDHRILHFLVEAIRLMSEGELIQLKYANSPEATPETYFQVIERKTAALFSCCCRCGAHTAQASETEIRLCEEIGRNIGLSFQIQDDLLDLDTENDNGKSYGNDLKEGKLTLPALYMLEHCSPSEKEKFLRGLDLLHEEEEKGMDPDRTVLNDLIIQIKHSQGEAYARRQASVFKEKALDSYHALRRPFPLFEDLIREICIG